MPRRSEQKSPKGNRWTRSRSRSRGRRQQQQRRQSEDDNSSAAAAAAASGTAHNHAVEVQDYVTSPPPVRKSGLTGNISKMFRRGSGKGGDSSVAPSVASSAVPSSTVASAGAISPPTTPSRKQRSRKRSSSRGRSTKKGLLSQQQPPEPLQATTFLQTGGGREGDVSVASSSVAYGGNAHQNNNNRLFYSNADDDDSQTSFENKSVRTTSGLSDPSLARGGAYNPYPPRDRSGSVSGSAGTASYSYSQSRHNYYDGDTRATSVTSGQYTYGTTSEGTDTYHTHDKSSTTTGGGNTFSTTILRYRGFSTSISSLFLDEALVCASMGCFGLILSNRTEYLLQLRNDRRGVQWGRSSSRRTLPSRIVAYALLLTLLLIGITFVVWGFGSDQGTGQNLFSNNWKNKDVNNSGGSSSGNYNAYDDVASNNNGGGGSYNAYDDVVNNNNNNYNNDDGGNNYNNNANDDDGGNNNANNDDGNNNYNNYNNDDGGNNDNGGNNNNYNNDDGGNNANNDDGSNNYNNNYNYNNNDDGGNNNYNNNNYNNYYYNNDDGGRQLLDQLEDASNSGNHPINGVFKVRDMKEGIWEPVIEFLSDEWYRPYEQKQNAQRQSHHDRDLQNGSSSNNNSSGGGFTGIGNRDLAADLRLSMIIAFLIVLGILGRRRRMRTRYYLVRARAQEDHLFYASSGTGIKRVGFQDSREDQYEGACSHTLCGCYPTDPPREGDEIEDEVQVSDDGVSQRKKTPRHEDCVSRGFNCIMALCCGFICKCWCQCLSICALAQEAREIRLLVPTRYQRVDYITHQPFHEYQKDVNDLRRGWLGKTRKKSGIMPHFNALSRLSRYILGLSIFCVVVIVTTLVFNPRASFSWPDAVVLIATFLQSFLVLWIVHWIFHKSDLSLDAVIKFFAAGFVIAVPASFFFEGLLVNITLSSAYIVYILGELIKGEVFVNWVVQHYRLLWILGEIFNAYVVAAVTEELCKYYTFRCVEHPDLIFLTGLVSTTSDDTRAHEGGLVKYPFSSHQVQKTNQRNPYDDEASQYSRGSHRSKSQPGGGRSTALDPPNIDAEDFEDDEPDVRTHRQKAAAVTTAMISVAVGLACAENFLYVFLLGGTSNSLANDDDSVGGYLEAWIVLLFRSIFPVHALAAAMQSVNMIRKFVETDDVNGHRISVGRIILPAVIMHGSFDAILLGINVFIETSWDDYLDRNGGVVDPDNPPYNAVLVNGVAWFSIILVMLLGLTWYFRENRNQRLRLIVLEEQEKAKENASYTSPAPHASEVELV